MEWVPRAEMVLYVWAPLSPWNIWLSLALLFVLLLIVVWRASATYSGTGNLDLRFRSRAVGVRDGAPASKILLDSTQSCDLSVIIPAFKEATRVPQSLKGTLLAAVDHLQEYARQNRGFSWEIIVVDDGSPDGTADSVINWTNHLPCAEHIRVVSLPCNMGKGAAVKSGMCVTSCSHPLNRLLSLHLCPYLTWKSQASRPGPVLADGRC